MKAFFSQQYISFTATHAILNKCHNPSIYNCYFFHVITKNDINKHVHNTLIEYNETPRSRNKWSTLYNVLSFDWKKKSRKLIQIHTRYLQPMVTNKNYSALDYCDKHLTFLK